VSKESRILVAAHEPIWRAFVAKVLRAEGYTVHLCGDTASTLLEIRDNDFDLIIVDILMEDLLEALAKESVSRRLLVVSANPSVFEAITAYRLGAIDYVNKAFGESSLLAIIESALQKQPAQQRSL
jgi:DNA-binding response OmpR family regulator